MLMDRLELSQRVSHMHECGGDVAVIDFAINGVRLCDLLSDARPDLMRKKELPDGTVAGNPDGVFVGPLVWTVWGWGDSFSSGHSERYSGIHDGLLPLLVCSDCGEPFCGAAWTRIAVYQDHVSWSGLGWPDDQGKFHHWIPSVIWRFERSEYERVFAEGKGKASPFLQR